MYSVVLYIQNNDMHETFLSGFRSHHSTEITNNLLIAGFALAVDGRGKTEKHPNKVYNNSLNKLLQRYE